jgi:hypothetical protein
MKVIKLTTQVHCVDMTALAPRVQSMISLILRDAELINACDQGSLEFHFARHGTRESVRPRITLCPPKVD